MGIIKLLREGSWWTRSDSDPRWNMDGRGVVGLLSMPPDAQAAVEAKRTELGEEPPRDLTYGYMKD